MNIGKLLLFGAAGYFLYNWWAQNAAAAGTVPPASTAPAGSLPSTTAPPSTSTSPGTSPVTVTTPAPGATPPAPFVQPPLNTTATTAQLTAAAASIDPNVWKTVASTTMTADQWNFYWGLGSGQAIPNVDLFPAGNRGQLIDVTTFHSWRHAHGLEGYRNGLAGLQWRGYPA